MLAITCIYHKSDTYSLLTQLLLVLFAAISFYFILFIRTIHYIRKMCSHNMLMAIKQEKFKTRTEGKKLKSEIKLLLYVSIEMPWYFWYSPHEDILCVYAF